MRKYKIVLLLLLSFSLVQTTTGQNNNEDDNGIWTGTVSFLEKQTGKEIIISEWRMEAKITNNIASVVHSYTFRSKNDNTSDCKTEDKTELEAGIDYETGKYSINVPMPGCYGKTTSNGSSTDFGKTDETAIVINDQPLKDPNVLEGTITEKNGGGDNEVTSVTTYTWRLIRTNKRKQTVSPNNNKSNALIAQPFKKETWSGTVTWIKTSSGKARITSTDHGFENVFRWDNYMAYHTDVNFINSKGIVNRSDTATKWEKDSVIFIHPENKYMIEERTTKIYRKGKEEFTLEVEFSEDRKTYWISFFGPICPEYYFFEKKNNIHGNASDSSTKEDAGQQITLPAAFTGYPVGANPNILVGKFEEIIPANPNDPSGQEIITRAKWELKKTGK